MTLVTRPPVNTPRQRTTSRTVYPFRHKFGAGAIRPREIYENFRTFPDETIDDIYVLRTWPKEWDGYQMAPSDASINHALSWIEGLYEGVLTMGREWLDPLVVADAHGNVVFEWLKGRKRLVVYVSPKSVEYLKVWGPDIWSDMEDGDVETPNQRKALWRWLIR